MFFNKLEKYLEKPSSEFTRDDIVRFFVENDFKYLNFRYVGGDGRLKELNFVIYSKEQLESILTTGERVDGSSLFTYVGACSSDLYVIPRYKTAFVNPFNEEPTLEIICSYYTTDGTPLETAPEYILKKAHDLLVKNTGFEFHAMGELEYYVIAPRADIYPATDQKGYHESTPYAKWNFIHQEAMRMLAECGVTIKYGHSEVGNFKQTDKDMEQYEIELLTAPVEQAAINVILTKWILRNLGYIYDVTISFAPKITVGKAGSGLHIHTKLMKKGKNMMVENDVLSDHAKKMIAGFLDLSPSLTAFGNTIPTSYLRLVPHQEAPTNICWGDRNRSVLVRVPLGWLGEARKMISHANPLEKKLAADFSDKQTVEFRCPDGSADIYLLLAGLTVAARHGLEMPDGLKKAEELYVNVNIFDDKHKEVASKLKQLPVSCYESADRLLEQSGIYCEGNVFIKGMINDIAKKLKSYEDKDLSEKLYGKNEEIRELVDKYLHC